MQKETQQNIQNEIQVLSSQVVDQIAAGEVVERPAHLVKELIENSLDAQATEITITIRDGGRDVRVEDNGKGMTASDLPRALDRFATSKIKDADDIWRLKTYGFRGEALASISSVAEVVISSVKGNVSNSGYSVHSNYGIKSDVEPTGISKGTIVEVKNLFGNVPARLKFMKSAAAEMTLIKNTIKAMALAYPKVSFRLYQESDLVFWFEAAEDLRSRTEQVLGKKELLYSELTRDQVRVRAVFSDPHQVERTAKNIWAFVQNRWVQDRTIQAAVMDAYRSLLMHGEYPVAAIWVDAELDFVDVNIHPTKSQVKFLDSSLVFRAVHKCVRELLEKAPWLKVAYPNSTAVPSSTNEVSQSPQQYESKFVPPSQNLKFEDVVMEKTQFQKKSYFSEQPEPPLALQAAVPSALQEQPVNDESKGYWSSRQVIGQANLTYIITQDAEGLLIVDQHAAHERVLFEKLFTKWKTGVIEAQEFLFPLSVDMGAEEVEALIKVAPELQRLGLVLEQLGPESIGVKSAPAILKDQGLAIGLSKLASKIVSLGGSFEMESVLIDLFATLACHSAIRAGQSLSHPEMSQLLSDMDLFPMSSFCPHGRPVSIKTSFQSLEKDFGRLGS